MNSYEKHQVKIAWIKTAAYYQTKLDDYVFEMYADDVADLSFQDVMAALESYRRDKKNTRAPLPAALIDKINPIADDDAVARDVASRIVSAVKRFGWTQPTEAKEHIGEIGWEVVRRNGGWQPLCETMPEDASIFQAQARDLAKSMMVMARAGKSNVAPSFPERIGGEPKQLESVKNILTSVKTIEPEREP